jgi:hypothetical protein
MASFSFGNNNAKLLSDFHNGVVQQKIQRFTICFLTAR